MSENSPRPISAQEAVRVACILFEMNTRPEALFELAARAGLPCDSPEQRAALLHEWLGFTHAAVLYSLMALAPNNVTLDYLRATRELLARQGYAPDACEAFIDDAFSAYAQPLIQDKRAECPRVFFSRLPGPPAPPHAQAALAGTMAMVLAAILDAWDKYTIQ